MAATLNNLGVFYGDTLQLTEAAEAYGEALQIYRELAEANPSAHRPDMGRWCTNRN